MKASTLFMRTVLLAIVCAACPGQAPAPRVYPAEVEKVYRVALDRGALLLESVTDVIRQNNITDGHVSITAGSVEECTYHYVTSNAQKPNDVYKTVKGAFEILSSGGIIADGQPHIHISLSAPGKSAFGGHLEKGCRILYLGEVTLVKYRGEALTRKPNANGISLLEAK